MLWEDKADILAGNLAGWAFVTVAQPLDYIKTMYQLKDHHLPSIRDMYREIGIKGFYKGASTMYAFSGAITALEFEAFESSLRKIKTWMGEELHREASPASLMMAGFVSGAVCSFIYTPTEYSKIQSQVSQFPDSGSTRRILTLLKKQRLAGLRKLYTGHPITMLKQSVGSSLYYGSYHITLSRILQQNRESAPVWSQILAGGLAGIVNLLYSYPLDTIKTNVQSGNKHFNDMIGDRFWKTPNFWRGLRVCVISSFISEATNFVVYENVRSYLLLEKAGKVQ